jgi:hypothetical protein
MSSGECIIHHPFIIQSINAIKNQIKININAKNAGLKIKNLRNACRQFIESFLLFTAVIHIDLFHNVVFLHIINTK